MQNIYTLATTSIIAVLSFCVFVSLALPSQTAHAQVNLNAPGQKKVTDDKGNPEPYTGDLKDNPIIDWIEFFVNLLTVVILTGSVIMIAVAGVQYTSSRDNAQSVQAAKQRIFNVLLGLVAYFFLYGFVQWLIPGGVF